MKLENDMVDKKFNIANLSMSSDVSGGGSPRKDFSIHGLLAAGMGLIFQQSSGYAPSLYWPFIWRDREEKKIKISRIFNLKIMA